MNHQPNSYDLDQCEIELIEKLMKCYSYCQKIRPELKNKIVFDVKQAEDAGLSDIEDDADSINLLVSLQDNGIIKKFGSFDPFDYLSPDDTPKFPGRIVIDVFDDFIVRAENRVLAINIKISSQRNGNIIIFFSPIGGELRTTENIEPSTKRLVLKEKRKTLIQHLFLKKDERDGGLMAADIRKLVGYKTTQSVNKTVAEINELFLKKLSKIEKLIINDSGYRFNRIYTILEFH